jgi:hypothetical protein
MGNRPSTSQSSAPTMRAPRAPATIEEWKHPSEEERAWQDHLLKDRATLQKMQLGMEANPPWKTWTEHRFLGESVGRRTLPEFIRELLREAETWFADFPYTRDDGLYKAAAALVAAARESTIDRTACAQPRELARVMLKAARHLRGTTEDYRPIVDAKVRAQLVEDLAGYLRLTPQPTAEQITEWLISESRDVGVQALLHLIGARVDESAWTRAISRKLKSLAGGHRRRKNRGKDAATVRAEAVIDVVLRHQGERRDMRPHSRKRAH